jgi:hypothetical protein
MGKRIDAAIVYQGPSRFDGSPIVAIVTGLGRKSSNPKTGRMAQLWIVPAEMSPLEAIDRGADFSVCGNCKHRPRIVKLDNGQVVKRASCYVQVKNAPLAVYRKFRRGGYPVMSPSDVAAYLRDRDLPIRFGAWGEPTALPWSVLADLAEGTDYTGYTHQWSMDGITAFRPLLMASVDNVRETEAAQAAGWRTFRTRTAEAPILPGEIACPASVEAGKRTTCAACTLCDGKGSAYDLRRNIAIVVHGASKLHYMTVSR